MSDVDAEWEEASSASEFEFEDESDHEDESGEASGDCMASTSLKVPSSSERPSSGTSKRKLSLSHLDAAKSLGLKKYTAYDPAACDEALAREAGPVVDVLGVSVDEAQRLLAAARWDHNRCISEYLADPEGSRAGASLCPDPDARARYPAKTAADGDGDGDRDGAGGGSMVTCDICFDDVPAGDVLSVCGEHAFCRGCWSGHLRSGIGDAHGLELRCPGFKCRVAVGRDDVAALLGLEGEEEAGNASGGDAGGSNVNNDAHNENVDVNDDDDDGNDEDLFKKYLRYCRRDLVSSNPLARWCPAPGCTYAIVATSGMPQSSTVECACGHAFCFGCGEESHLPATCADAALWKQKCSDNSETVNWLLAHTQPCPKCFQPIEKNGGCNHITHRACGAEFCWVCRGNWADHKGNYNCNRYDEETKKDKEDAHAKLDRYIHYFRRFQNHHESRQLEAKLRVAAAKRMADLQASGDVESYAEVTYLLEACDALSAARGTLKWSYVKAFFLPQGEERTLFEYRQEVIEMTVENLSGILEGGHAKDLEGNDMSPVESRMLVINLTAKLRTEQMHMKEG